MSSSLSPASNTPKRSWSIAQKRRVVELTLHQGVSVRSIAKQYAIHPPMLSTWRKLYRNGKLVDNASEETSILETFLPVHMTDSQPSSSTSSNRICAQIDLPCGASLRLEADTLDLQAIAMLFASVRK